MNGKTEDEGLADLMRDVDALDAAFPNMTFAKSQAMLGRTLDRLMATNLEMLATIIAQADVGQEKMEHAMLNMGKDETPGLVLAKLIIARQLERIKE